MGTNGLVLGKFYPPHRGHEHLIRFADAYCDTLFVVLGSLESETISGALRISWIKKIFPNIEILHLDQELPQYPEEHPDFWKLRNEALTDLIPAELDFVFTSEAYGEALAENLGAAWVSIDAGRETIDICASRIRENPVKYWSHLHDVVKPFFRKGVVICGPESSGKTTLTKRLSNYYSTQMVPEYARQFLERKGGEIVFEDMEKIARGQQASEKALAYHAGPYLFCHPDIRFEPDPIRYLPEERDTFFENSKHDLLGKNVVEIFGDAAHRFQTAQKAVEDLQF